MNSTDEVSTTIAIGEPYPGQGSTPDQLYPGKAGGTKPDNPGIAVGEPYPSTGTSGDDQLYAGKGAGTVDGGSGDDTAVLMGSYADYRVTHDAATGDIVIVSLDQGDQVSRLVNVEHLRFADLMVEAAEADTGAQARHTATMDDDLLVGNDLGYGLQGHDGNDTFIGNGGDDTLYGGKGDDVAVFRGALSDYTIEHEAWSGTYRVIDHVRGRDGTDLLWNIEQLRFADQTVDPAAVAVELPPPDYPILWVMDGDLAVIDPMIDLMITVALAALEAPPVDIEPSRLPVIGDAGVSLVGVADVVDDFGGSLP